MQEVIRSPFRNCEAHLKRVPDTMKIRGKVYHFVNHFYVCDESGEEFTDEETGDYNFNQVYDKYREEINIPLVHELIQFRKSLQFQLGNNYER